ncbi:DUF2931 family protein [Sphingobacterium sp. ML3W]|uniref:DUF2931 family protein n=1 Tax=Sphingobacterium sp. ML3W TaxID=1538644 RepID=UPI001F1F3B1D|nr:DUF2931 family protein [Sphingobacterium sp. ML3W]
MLKIYTLLSAGFFGLSCNGKAEKASSQAVEEFHWRETISCPVGFPIDVHDGALILPGGGSVGLYLGTHNGPWGATGRSMSNGLKPLPKKIDVIWLSYAEDAFYEIDTAIDYDKILALFKEGYLDSNTKKNRTYTTIVVGFAPGGVVVVWLNGPGKQVEVGRYQGKKTVIPAEEIAKLDNHEKLLFSPEYRKEIMLNEKIVPKEVREANAGKPIPYGLWDRLRQKHIWKSTYSIADGGQATNAYFIMQNGEEEQLIDETFEKNIFEERAIPRIMNFGWRAKNGQHYGGGVVFDDDEIVKAYEKIFKNKPIQPVELVISVNEQNTGVAATLKCGEQEISMLKMKVSIFKSSKK